MNKPNQYTEIVSAYVNFLASSTQTAAEVYTKTWQDVTKLQQTVTKELFSSNDFYKNFSNWTDFTSKK